MNVIVELVCKAEGDKVVANIETPEGKLSALLVSRGLKSVDSLRSPGRDAVRDGVQLSCRRCHEPLWFRVADGQTFAAMPGSVEVKA